MFSENQTLYLLYFFLNIKFVAYLKSNIMVYRESTSCKLKKFESLQLMFIVSTNYKRI